MTERKITILITILFYFIFSGITLNSAASVSEGTSLPSFVAFESGQVRPLALSPDGMRLYAVNTPDNRLEVFDIVGLDLKHRFSVPVGMEPVAALCYIMERYGWLTTFLIVSVWLQQERIEPVPG